MAHVLAQNVRSKVCTTLCEVTNDGAAVQDIASGQVLVGSAPLRPVTLFFLPKGPTRAVGFNRKLQLAPGNLWVFIIWVISRVSN